MYSPDLVELAIQYQDKRTSNIRRWWPDITTRIENETSFLPINASISQRFYHILNNTTQPPKCKYCAKFFVKWHASKGGYVQYCSTKCAANGSQDIKVQTLNKRYNVDSYSKTEEFKNKLKTVANNRSQETRDIIQQKRKDTCNKIYKHDYATQAVEVKQKIANTNTIRYNSPNYLSSDIGKAHLQRSNMLKYDTEIYSTSTIPKNIRILINDTEWLLDQHHIQKKTLNQIAKELNIDLNTVIKYIKKSNITHIRHECQSQGERDITILLQSYNINIITNTRSVITPKELDIYLPDYNIAIEFCGLFWHCDRIVDPKYHQEKYQKCKDLNIRLLTIFEDEWEFNQDLVKNKILHILKLSEQSKIFARKCGVKIVPAKEKKIFYNQNHIQGSGPGSLTYGLYYNNQLVSCMTFIVKQNGVYELNRYATSYNVVGGFSKLLSYFESNHLYSKIISYADLRWSVGNMYEANGFILDSIVSPTYEYVINNRRTHRSNFMRSKLFTRLGDNFNSNLTEFQNCDRAGIPRIWNCGLLRYIRQK